MRYKLASLFLIAAVTVLAGSVNAQCSGGGCGASTGGASTGGGCSGGSCPSGGCGGGSGSAPAAKGLGRGPTQPTGVNRGARPAATPIDPKGVRRLNCLRPVPWTRPPASSAR